jgi:hypothetical protein
MENKEPIYERISGNKVVLQKIGYGNNGNRKKCIVSSYVST